MLMNDVSHSDIVWYGVRESVTGLQYVSDVLTAVSPGFIRMPEKPGTAGMIWLASGVACAAIFLDLTARYFWRRPHRHLPASVSTKATQTNAGYDVRTETELRLVASLALGGGIVKQDDDPDDLLTPGPGYSVRRQTSRSSSRRSSVSRQDGGVSRSESLQQAISALQHGGLTASDGGGARGVHDVLNDLVEAMRTNVQLAASVKSDVYPRSCKDKVGKLRNIKQDLDTLSNDVTSQAIGLLDLDDVSDDRPEADIATENGNGTEALSASLSRRAFLRSQWLSLRRLLFCVDLQLRHAAIYHVFFEESRELKKLLLELHKQVRTYGEVDHSLTVDQFTRTSDYLGLLQTNIRDLAARSPYVVPLRMRKEPISEPLPAKCICSLTSDNMEVHDGDSVTLLDNSNEHAWTIRHASGAEAQIPAVCCIIPPPDKDALLSAARLEKAVVAIMNMFIMYVEPWLLAHCKTVISTILDKQDTSLKRLTSSRKQETRDDVRHLGTELCEQCCHLESYQEASDDVERLESVIQGAAVTQTDDPEIQKDLSEPLQEMLSLLGALKGVQTKKQEAETVSLSHGLDQYLNEETLDWVTPLLEGADSTDGLAVSVHHQETEVAETSSFTSSSGEVRQTFSISGVLDPRDQKEMSIADAISAGILDPERGLYIHPIDGSQVPIPIAMNAGLILVQTTQTKQMQESVKAVGLVTVNVTRETRPYTILRVRDAASEEEVPVADAIARGLFDQQSGFWINPSSDERIPIRDAIDAGLLIVEYDAEAAQAEPEVTSRTFAVYGVSDRKQGKRVPFHEACERGIISKEDGEFLDTRTGEKHSVIQAARRGWVKVRVVEDGTQMEDIISRNRSDSLDSVQSSASSTGS